ncbi:MAG: hypothetical protein OYL97_21745 [Candidatus Poribacteria bacterium]|nr:hypothetical protein [Candidatus Poribacteria bacterium]
MYKLSVRLFLFNVALLAIVVVPDAMAQFQAEPPTEETQQSEPEVYSESALRRFEIVTLSSLPFTAIHSYAIMRGVKMFSENKFAPELTPADYRIIGIGAVSLSVFIGVWDWLHTRNVDRSAPRVPEPQTPPPVEEEEPVEGTLARLSETSPYTARYQGRSLEDSINKELNGWANERPIGFAVPFIQVRF